MKEDTNCETHDLIKCPCDLQEDVKYSHTDINEDDALNNERSCRIGTQTNVDSNKTLDQLLDWQHFGPPFEPETFQVRYLFANETLPLHLKLSYRISVWNQLFLILAMYSAHSQLIVKYRTGKEAGREEISRSPPFISSKCLVSPQAIRARAPY